MTDCLYSFRVNTESNAEMIDMSKLMAEGQMKLEFEEGK